MLRERVDGALIRGRVRGHYVAPHLFVLPIKPVACRPPDWHPFTHWCHNSLLFEWGAIVGSLLLGKPGYKIGGMYLEYDNVADPDTPVVPPAFSRQPEEGVTYYNGLITSGSRDYLRVPLTAGLLNISPSGEANFPKGNSPTFFAMTSGVVGVHGKAFSDVNNSKVYGGALVALIDEADASQDLVLSRFYFPDDEQLVKLPTSQVGIEWAIDLE